MSDLHQLPLSEQDDDVVPLKSMSSCGNEKLTAVPKSKEKMIKDSPISTGGKIIIL